MDIFYRYSRFLNEIADGFERVGLLGLHYFFYVFVRIHLESWLIVRHHELLLWVVECHRHRAHVRLERRAHIWTSKALPLIGWVSFLRFILRPHGKLIKFGLQRGLLVTADRQSVPRVLLSSFLGYGSNRPCPRRLPDLLPRELAFEIDAWPLSL